MLVLLAGTGPWEAAAGPARDLGGRTGRERSVPSHFGACEASANTFLYYEFFLEVVYKFSDGGSSCGQPR